MIKIYSRKVYFCCLALAATVFCLSAATVFAQEKSSKTEKKRDFCSGNNYSYNGKMSYKETREMTINAVNLLTVDGQRNGGIHIIGENRSDILIRACVQTTGATEQEAQTTAKNIRIETGSTIRAENTPDNEIWGVSYEIRVPRSTNLKLNAQNGGISIDGVDSTSEFETQNGGIHLTDVAGSMRGKTTNGGVHVELSGGSWKGAGLDVQTTNGGVHISIPENYAAHFETKTTNGGFKSEIAALRVERKERNFGANISTDLNGGGAPIRVVTTNGGVHISSSSNESF